MFTAEGHEVHSRHKNSLEPPDAGQSATPSGVLALALAGVATLTAPAFLLVPYVGFLPALIAGAGALVAARGLRSSPRGTGAAVTGLMVCVIASALLAGTATIWTLVVADPAIRDYDELHEVVEYIKHLIVG